MGGAMAQSMQSAFNQQQQQPQPSQTASGGASAVEELTKLKGLLDAGIIDQDEFNRLKGDVMKRLG